MKISQLVEKRAGGDNSTRAASQAAGQSIGRSMRFLSPDQAQRSIQAQKNNVAAQQPQATGQPTLAQRLAARKAEKLQQATQANQQNAPVPAGNDGGQIDPALTNAPLPGSSQADPALTNPNTALANPNTPQNITATPQENPKTKSKVDWGKVGNTAMRFVDAVPKGVGAFTNLVGNTAQNMAPGLRNTAHAIGDVGNAAARGIGGIGNALGATTDALGRTAGGFQAGYQKALGTHASQTGGGGGGNSIGNNLRQSAGVGGGGGGGVNNGNSVTSLSQRLLRVEKELGLAESKRQGTYYPNARRKAS